MTKRLGSTFFTWVVLINSYAIGLPSDPVYHCEFGKTETLDVFYEKNSTRVVRSETKTGKRTEWLLAEELAFNDPPREPIRYRFSLPEKGKKIDWKTQFEFREQFFRELSPQELRMMLIQEGEILVGWKCAYRGAAMNLKMLESPTDFSRADLLFVARAVKGFLNEEQLQDRALLMLIQVVERFGLWSKTTDKVDLKKLVLSVFQPVVYLSAGMVKQVDSQLTELGKLAWKLILSETEFENFSPVQKWIFWVGLAERKNNEAVRAGIRGFVKSSVFHDQSVKTFFKKETKQAMQSLSHEQYQQIRSSGLNPAEKAFFDLLWKNRTLSN